MNQFYWDEPEYQIHHTSYELYHTFTHPATSVPSGLTTKVRIELHVICKCGFRIGHMEESVDVVFLSDDLVDDLSQGGLI